MPTTAPAMSTKTSTRVIPFFRSAFSPKKCPALNKNPIRKITPRIMGKMARIVSETSFTESSIPPICAKAGVKENNKIEDIVAIFFIGKSFEFIWILLL